MLSVIIPVFNEESNIKSFYDSIINKLIDGNISYEIIFIDDGSTDKSLEIIKELKNVKYISFSRNFGKESAIFAGLEHVKGDIIAVMDADGQDPLELIPQMYDYILNHGYDMVACRRKNRKGEPFIKSVFSNLFYKVFNKISDIQLKSGVRDYRMFKREVLNSILKLKEYNRFSKGIFQWVGYKTKYIEFENIQRKSGQTKWSFYKLLMYSFEAIISFSAVPLVISSFIGIFFVLLSCIMSAVYFFKTIFFGDPVTGFPTIICSIFMIGGIQLFCIGILGQYLAKIYMETKNRPIYIIRENNL